MSSSSFPLVTIGIPVYNGQKYLRQCLDSATNQDYQNLEIVICDNQSTDDTRSICQEFASSDSRIVYHCHDRNIGAIANFNYVLEIANGELFTWLAHDDYLAPTYISKCVERLANNPQSIGCCSEIEFINEDGSLRNVWSNYYKNIDGLNKNVVERVREITSRVGWYAIYSVFRTETLRNISPCQARYADDVLMLLELSIAGEIAKVPERLFYYRVADVDKTPQDYCRALGLDAKTTTEIGQESFTHTAKNILDVVYESKIEIADKHRIKSEFIDTLIDRNHDWLSRIIQEQKWTDTDLTYREKLAEL
jgi:glycosyltransferase involved in cell wall biosynthesis